MDGRWSIYRFRYGSLFSLTRRPFGNLDITHLFTRANQELNPSIGDKGGVIVVWDPFQQKKTLKFELPTKPSISCMSSSPTQPDVVAIGYV